MKKRMFLSCILICCLILAGCSTKGENNPEVIADHQKGEEIQILSIDQEELTLRYKLNGNEKIIAFDKEKYAPGVMTAELSDVTDDGVEELLVNLGKTQDFFTFYETYVYACNEEEMDEILYLPYEIQLKGIAGYNLGTTSSIDGKVQVRTAVTPWEKTEYIVTLQYECGDFKETDTNILLLKDYYEMINKDADDMILTFYKKGMADRIVPDASDMEGFWEMIRNNEIDQNYFLGVNITNEARIKEAVTYRELWEKEAEQSIRNLEFLVDDGIYADLQSAYEGWNNYMESLHELEEGICCRDGKWGYAGHIHMMETLATRTKDHAVELMALEYYLTEEKENLQYEDRNFVETDPYFMMSEEEYETFFTGTVKANALYYEEHRSDRVALADTSIQDKFWYFMDNNPIDKEYPVKKITSAGERKIVLQANKECWEKEVKFALEEMGPLIAGDMYECLQDACKGWETYVEMSDSIEMYVYGADDEAELFDKNRIVESRVARTKEFAIELMALEYYLTGTVNFAYDQEVLTEDSDE